jgi:hypothetical protein
MWTQKNEELHNLYAPSPNIVSGIKLWMVWTGSTARKDKTKVTYKILIEKSRRQRTVGRPDCSLRIFEEI